MKNHRLFSFLLAITCTASLLTGCGQTVPASSSSGAASWEHEPITMQAPFRNISAFIDVVHEKYPEINLEVIPYSGKNYTAYVKAELAADDMPDVYCTSYYTPGLDNVSGRLIDLAGYAFTDNYAEARLQDVTDSEGAIYLLPTYYDCVGITYNKTLLEKHGWTLPTSLKELEELAPQVAAAGCNLCLDEIQLPGYGFQYLCDILDTGYLNTPDGRAWQNSFLKGEVTLAGSPEMMENLRVLEKWRDLGMLNGNGDPKSDNDTRLEMAKGNTLFLLGSSNTFTAEETTDEFGLMPFLSEDGTKNAFILNVSRFIGLNKHLEQPGNEQSLEDALHVMEILSTVEGMQALNSTYASTSLLPLKDYAVNQDSYYADIEGQLNSGATAPFIYNGWTNVVVPIGEAMLAFVRGDATLDDVVNAFDSNQHLIWDNTSVQHTTVTQKIDTDHCAKLVGICFAKAAGADMALISKNKWYKIDGAGDLNLDGVSGALFPLPVTDEELVSILPTGWRQDIQTVTLTGARVKELAETGYDRSGDGEHLFPYELVTPENFSIDDQTLYTVVIAGVTDEVAEEGDLTDTGILGLDAAREYISQFEQLSEKDIIWE